MSLLLLLRGAGGGGPTVQYGAVSFTGTGSFTAISRVYGAASFTGTGTLTARAGLPVFAQASFAGTSSALFVSRFTGDDYRLYAVAMDGTVYGQLEDAKVGAVTFELNGVGGLDFTLPTTDSDTSLVQAGREVQLWRGTQLLFWGPIVRIQIGLDEASYQCSGLLWYFTRRYMGRADRVNLLVNGDFETSETGWSFANGVTHSSDVTRKIEGTKSLKLTGATADNNQYAYQDYTSTSESFTVGDFVIVGGYVYVPAVSYLGGSFEDRGIMAVHYRAGNVIDVQVATIDDDTVKDDWVYLEVLLKGVKEDDTVQVRLYATHGVAYWDLVTATHMESLSFGNVVTGAEVDVNYVVGGIVDYAQDRAPFDFDHGKSDLNIGHAGDPTGETVLVAYQFAEHRNVADAIVEYVQQGIIDIDFILTPTTRTLTTFAPRKGHYRADLTLQLDTTVSDFSYSWDGEAAASNVVVLGPGDGPDRPEGGAADTTFFGGLSLEWVESAPEDVTVGQLDDRAAERLRIGTHPETINVTTLPGAGIVGQLQTGDTVPVVISRGPLAINTTYRAVQISVAPDTDQATVTLNAET